MKEAWKSILFFVLLYTGVAGVYWYLEIGELTWWSWLLIIPLIAWGNWLWRKIHAPRKAVSVTIRRNYLEDPQLYITIDGGTPEETKAIIETIKNNKGGI